MNMNIFSIEIFHFGGIDSRIACFPRLIQVRLVLRRNAPDLNENERELAIQDAVAIQVCLSSNIFFFSIITYPFFVTARILLVLLCYRLSRLFWGFCVIIDVLYRRTRYPLKLLQQSLDMIRNHEFWNLWMKRSTWVRKYWLEYVFRSNFFQFYFSQPSCDTLGHDESRFLVPRFYCIVRLSFPFSSHALYFSSLLCLPLFESLLE